MASKRSAANGSSAGEPALKRLVVALVKKHIVPVALYEDVVEIITHKLAAMFLGEESRQMLLVALPHGLCIPMEKREGAQQHTVSMVRELMLKIFDRMQAELTCANSEANLFNLKMADQADRVAKNVRELAQVLAGGAACKQWVQERMRCLQASQADVASANAVLSQDVLDLAHLEAAKASYLRMLNASDFGDATPEMLYHSLAPSLLKLDIDASLRVAAEHALLVRANQRTSFQNHVVQELEKSCVLQIQKLRDSIAETNAAQTVGGVYERTLCDKLAKDTVDFEAATNSLQVHQAHVKKVKQDLERACVLYGECQQSSQKAKEARAQRQKELLDFVNSKMTSFYALADRVPDDTTVPDAGSAASGQ